MEFIIGFALLLMPIFITIAIWTNLIEKTWTKIILTIISSIFMFVLVALGNRQNTLEESESALNYCSRLDTQYLQCLDDSKDDDGMMDCVFDNRKQLIEIYK